MKHYLEEDIEVISDNENNINNDIDEEKKSDDEFENIDIDELLEIDKEFNGNNEVDESKIPKKRVGRKKIDVESRAKPTDKIHCDICGVVVTRSNYSRHKKSGSHQKLISIFSKLRKYLVDEPVDRKLSIKEIRYRRCLEKMFDEK